MLVRLVVVLVPALLSSLISGWATLAWTNAGYPVGVLVAAVTGVGVTLLVVVLRKGKQEQGLGRAVGRIISRIRAKRDVIIRDVGVDSGDESLDVLADIESKRGSVWVDNVEVHQDRGGRDSNRRCC